MSKPITEAGTINQFYWSDEMSKKLRELAINANPLQAIEESEPMDDNCPSARIGELGNQAHNLGCDYQNDEDLSDELGKVAVTLWDLAKKAASLDQVQRERNEVENKALDEVYWRIGDDNLVRTVKETVAALYDAGMLRRAGE